jgi:hypothetical protein
MSPARAGASDSHSSGLGRDTRTQLFVGNVSRCARVHNERGGMGSGLAATTAVVDLADLRSIPGLMLIARSAAPIPRAVAGSQRSLPKGRYRSPRGCQLGSG